jgi:integrase
VKQQLAAVRMLFDWLITGQVVPTNPASAVRGPKHVVKTGKTPVLDGKEWRTLLDSIPTDTRARPGADRHPHLFLRPHHAALKMKVEDLRPQGASWRLRLHEKGGKHHTMPCHHALAEALHAYIAAAGIAEDRQGLSVPHQPWPRRHPAIRAADDSIRRLAHDPKTRGRRRHLCADRQSHISRDRHHSLPCQWRRARTRPGNGGAREPAHDQAL